jgi:hypothetical protein
MANYGRQWPDRIATGFKIKDQLPRRLLHVRTVIHDGEYPKIESMQEVLAGWPMEFISQEEIPEISLAVMEKVESLQFYIRLSLLVTREQEFILRLQHGHELPGR